jgi:hypothetical protein
LNPKHIDKLSFSLVSGKSIDDFAFGGFGVSRYELDKYLYNEAIKIGCTVVQETVSDVEFFKIPLQLSQI